MMTLTMRFKRIMEFNILFLKIHICLELIYRELWWQATSKGNKQKTKKAKNLYVNLPLNIVMTMLLSLKIFMTCCLFQLPGFSMFFLTWKWKTVPRSRGHKQLVCHYIQCPNGRNLQCTGTYRHRACLHTWEDSSDTTASARCPH